MTHPSNSSPWEPVEAAFTATDAFVEGLHLRTYEPRNRVTPRLPLIMVHGGFQAAWVFSYWGPIFATLGWRALALSLRGHGSSWQPGNRDFAKTRVEDYADDVETLYRALGEDPLLLGHSLGGLVVQRVARRGIGKALVLVASVVSPQLLGRAPRPFFPEEAPLVFNAYTTEPVSQRHFYNDGLRVGALVDESMGPESPAALNDSGGGRLISPPDEISVPVLCVHGSRDVTAVPDARAVAALFGGTALEIPDCGHCVMLDGASHQAALLVDNWLKRHLWCSDNS